MKSLSPAQRLIAHLNSNGKEYYKPIVEETNRVLSELNKDKA